MTPPWDWFGYGAIVGGATGMWVGYQVRLIVERHQGRKLYKGMHLKTSDGQVREITSVRKGVIHTRDAEPDRFVSYKEPIINTTKMPNVIPMHRARTMTPEEVTPVDRPGNPWRNDVIEALMGAGYKKAEAAKAVDSVPLPERMPGLEAWTAAALRNAARKP